MLDRYLDGDFEGVWHDIRAKPAGALDQDDVWQVALETARRARSQIDEIIAGFHEIGFRPALDSPMREVAPPDVVARLVAVEAKMGPLPAMLRASVIEIGNVCLSGDSDELGLKYNENRAVPGSPPSSEYPDPLWLPGIEVIEVEAEMALEVAEAEGIVGPFEILIAPDEYHKAAISGGAQAVILDATTPDPVIDGIHGREGITYLQYLRTSVSWGGLPGYEFGDVPAAVERLRRAPKF